MTDKQLLELSARGAGYSLRRLTAAEYPECTYWLDAGRWNPIDANADAFRLMVDLELNVFFVNGKAYAMDSESDHEQQVEIGNDKYAAMRKAILQCAASIGKQMEDV